MSDVTRVPASSAADIKAQASSWLERRDRDTWSSADQEMLDAWLAASPAHRVAYLRIGSAWERTQRLVVLRALPSRDEAPARRRLLPIAAGLTAACAAVLIAISFVYSPATQERTYRTAVGGHEIVTLRDGSKVELNTDTVLHARVSRTSRELWLDRGEAFFQIAHDVHHPFTVRAGDRLITVLGTKFSVRRDDKRVQVAVVEGRVRFAAVDGDKPQQSVVLTPGAAAIANNDGLAITHKATQALNNELGWRHGMLVFNNTTLQAAAAEFNRYNDRKIVVADSATARLTIDGTFPVNDAANFTNLAQAILGLHVEYQGNETVISR